MARKDGAALSGQEKGTAQAIQQALRMPLDERRARHERLLAGLRAQDVHWWAREFLSALGA